MSSVDKHWFPSFWPWACYNSICWDFQLAISQQFILRDTELWPPLLWVIAFLPLCYFQPYLSVNLMKTLFLCVCWLFVISREHVACWQFTSWTGVLKILRVHSCAASCLLKRPQKWELCSWLCSWLSLWIFGSLCLCSNGVGTEALHHWTRSCCIDT